MGRGKVSLKSLNSSTHSPCGVGLKSRTVPTPPPLWGGKNLCRVKQGGAEKVGWGKITIMLICTSLSQFVQSLIES